MTARIASADFRLRSSRKDGPIRPETPWPPWHEAQFAANNAEPRDALAVVGVAFAADRLSSRPCAHAVARISMQSVAAASENRESGIVSAVSV